MQGGLPRYFSICLIHGETSDDGKEDLHGSVVESISAIVQADLQTFMSSSGGNFHLSCKAELIMKLPTLRKKDFCGYVIVQVGLP